MSYSASPLSRTAGAARHITHMDGTGWLALCVLKEIPIITFSWWFTKLLASLMCRYGQKVTLVKKWVNYMPWKGVKAIL